MFNVTSAVECMAGSVVPRGTAKHTEVKTRHFYLARTRHLHIAATGITLIIVIMSNHIDCQLTLTHDMRILFTALPGPAKWASAIDGAVQPAPQFTPPRTAVSGIFAKTQQK